MSEYRTSTKAPIETKVKAASLGSYLGGVALLAILNGVTTANLVAGMPDWLEVFLAPMVPTAVAFVSGFVAKHTPRPDLKNHVN
jgi:hypothetical protein